MNGLEMFIWISLGALFFFSIFAIFRWMNEEIPDEFDPHDFGDRDP